MSVAVGVQCLHEAGVYDRLRRATFASVGVCKVKPDPGELILWNGGVMNNIEASAIKTQQHRPLLGIYRQICPLTISLRPLLAVLHKYTDPDCCNQQSARREPKLPQIRAFLLRVILSFPLTIPFFIFSRLLRGIRILQRLFHRLRPRSSPWRREWDLNPRGPKAHRISTPGPQV